MSDYNKYSDGSRWRKWDLHLHTPNTTLNNQFIGSDRNLVWAEYYEALSSDSNICTIGVTDYFGMNGLREVLAEKEGGGLSNIELILFNCELRILPVTSTETPINLHLLFSPDIISELERKFFSQLEYEYQVEKYLCTREELIKLGRKYRNDQTLIEDRAYKDGVEQYKVNIGDLKKIFIGDQRLRKNTLIGVSNSNNDGASGIQHSSLATTREDIYRFADFIFSSNPNDVKYFLGEGVDSKEEIIRKYGSLKPCIHGCDAHSNDKVYKPDLDRFTWIKADPTFEGLRQILFEPKLRARIQPHQPEEKNKYLTIDKVRYLDSASRKVFSPEHISMSSYLNSIIGGKSSGKSLLLLNIARAIDPEEVKEKAEDLMKKYDSKDRNYDFEIVWSDGYTSKKSDTTVDKRKITYIPQLYISKLVDEENELIGFNKLILDALKEMDKPIQIDGAEKSVSSIYDESILKINSTNSEIAKLVNDLFNEIEIEDKVKEEIKEIGDITTIKAEVSNKKEIIKALTKKSELTDEQTDSFTSLTKQEEDYKKQTDVFNTQITALGRFDVLIDQSIKDLKLKMEKTQSDIKEEYQLDQQTSTDFARWVLEFDNKTSEYLAETKTKIQGRTKEYQTKLEEVNIKISTLKGELKPILDKISNQQQLKELTEDIEKQNILVKNLEDLEKQYQKSRKKYDEVKNEIIEKYSNEFSTYKRLIEILKQDEIRKIDSIEIQTTLKINLKRFRNNFSILFDNRIYFQKDSKLFDGSNNLVFNETTYVSLIKELIEKLLSNNADNFVLKEAYTLKDALLKLLENYFEIEFDVLYKGDNLMQMSPGKIGLILVHLYLQFSNAKYPILIDQPEENLDNRTVYEELVNFIREKKIQRQIIIVTHNPNLVVSTDSEQIIVCNQGGQQANKDNKEYTFEYVSGSLEFTQEKDEAKQGILYKMGIREHVCDILEGGKEAFEKREQKYGFA